MSRYQAYPEYKDSGVEWLGVIPKHWAYVRLKNTANLVGAKVESGSSLKYVGMENIESGNGKYVEKEDVSPEGLTSSFAQGNVLFGKLRPYLAKSWLADFSGVCSSEFLVLDSKKVSPRFLNYFTLTDEFIKQVDSSTYGSKMPRASWDFIGLLDVPVPFDESEKIANFLDHETAKIDTLIEKQQQLIQLLKEKRQAVISHAVTKGLNPNAPMKDSGVEWLGEVPEGWALLPLKRAIELQRGHDLPSDSRVEGEFPIVSSGGVIAYHNESKAKGPGIVTGRYGTIGEFYLEERDYWPLNTALYGVSTYKNNVKYLWYMLQNIKHLFLLNSMKSAVPGVDRNDLHPEIISLPADLDEQKLIIQYLDKKLFHIDRVEHEALKAIELMQERRTALISAAVTGKIDVRHFVAEGGQGANHESH